LSNRSRQLANFIIEIKKACGKVYLNHQKCVTHGSYGKVVQKKISLEMERLKGVVSFPIVFKLVPFNEGYNT